MQQSILLTLSYDDLKVLVEQACEKAIHARFPTDEDINRNVASEPLITYKELSEEIFGGRISLVTLIKWTQMGLIPHIRMGRRVFFKRHEVEKAMAKSSRLSSRR